MRFRRRGLQIERGEQDPTFQQICMIAAIMFDFNEKYAVRIEELDPTVRLFNILKRAGLDTVEKIRWKILRNPEDILKLIQIPF